MSSNTIAHHKDYAEDEISCKRLDEHRYHITVEGSDRTIVVSFDKAELKTFICAIIANL